MVYARLTNEVLSGAHIKSQLLAAGATANGSAIVEPQQKALGIRFCIHGGAQAANSALRARVQGLKRSDGTTWEDVVDALGTNPIGFAPALMVDAGELETSGMLQGSFFFKSIDPTQKYGSFRLQVVEIGGGGGGSAQIAVSYDLFELLQKPSGSVDRLFEQSVYGT